MSKPSRRAEGWGLASDVVDDACVTFWRGPDFDHDSKDRGGGDDMPPPPVPFSADVLERFAILDATMSAAHPHSVSQRNRMH